MANGAQNKQAQSNIRGRRGMAEAPDSPTEGFFTPLVLSLGPTAADDPGTPNPMGRPSRAAEAS